MTARWRVQGRTGKLDIDYQVLHDAFFKHQSKPELSHLGDLYYEGKEFEAMVRAPAPAVSVRPFALSCFAWQGRRRLQSYVQTCASLTVCVPAVLAGEEREARHSERGAAGGPGHGARRAAALAH